MRGFGHLAGVLAVTLAALAGTASLTNDYQLRIAFMVCVYYLCAAGMNVLVGFAGQKSLGQAGLFAAGAQGAGNLAQPADCRHSGPGPDAQSRRPEDQ